MTTTFNNRTNQYTTTLVLITCSSCGVPFGLSETHYDLLVKSGESFHCPNGHKQHFTRKQELEDKVKHLQTQAKELSELWHGEQRRHQVTGRQLAARKGQITKMKKRAAAGVCPCCNRTFQQLADHMATQHPDYAEGEV